MRLDLRFIARCSSRRVARARPPAGFALPSFAFVHRERIPLTQTAGYVADTRNMPDNSAPAAYQQQGEVLNAFARDQNAPNADFAALLDEDYQRSLKPVKKDARLPAEAEAKNFRYHSRRRMVCLFKSARSNPNAIRLKSTFPILRHDVMAPLTARRGKADSQI
jgi:hypothetical protein